MILAELRKNERRPIARDQQDRPGRAADGAAADRAPLDRTGLFERVFIVSALTGDGCDDLLQRAERGSARGPWLFPEDQLSDLSQRAMAAEITREKLFEQLHQELPYSLTVETENWAAAADGSEVRIDQTIYVQRDSQKAIVLGKGGRQIKAVGQAARAELEQMLGAAGAPVPVRQGAAEVAEDPERYRGNGAGVRRLSDAVDRRGRSADRAAARRERRDRQRVHARGTAAMPGWCAAAPAAGRGRSTSRATSCR